MGKEEDKQSINESDAVVTVINQDEPIRKKKSKTAKILGVITGSVIVLLLAGTIVATCVIKDQNKKYIEIKNIITSKIEQNTPATIQTYYYIGFENNILKIITNYSQNYIIESNIDYSGKSYSLLDEVLEDIYLTKDFPNFAFTSFLINYNSYDVKYIPEVKEKIDKGGVISNSHSQSYRLSDQWTKYRVENLIMSYSNSFIYLSYISDLDGKKINYQDYNTNYLINFAKTLF